MKCRISEKLLSRYIDNALPKRLAAYVEKHLEGCAACKAKVAFLMKMNQALQAVPEVEESLAFDIEFNKKLDEAIEKASHARFYEVMAENFIAGVKDTFGTRVPVLARAAVTVIFMFAALFTGLYLTETGYPTVTSVEGVGFIQKANTGVWKALEKGMIIREGDMVKAAPMAQINLSLASKYHVRLNDASVIKIAKLTPKHRSGEARVSLKNGDVMVDIDKKFQGSHFWIDTDNATTEALGTKYMVSMSEKQRKTWVGVLEGIVEVESQRQADEKMKVSKVAVSPGMKAEVTGNNNVSEPEPLSVEEWRQMSELYMIGKKTKVALFISSDKNRVLELLSPCAIYISDEYPCKLPEELIDAAYIIQKAIKDDDMDAHKRAIDKIYEAIKKYPRAPYNVQLLLYIGAYNYFIEDYQAAVGTFQAALEKYPNSGLSSLAECAIAYIYQENLDKPMQAKDLYQNIMQRYPQAPEAQFARGRFQTT